MKRTITLLLVLMVMPLMSGTLLKIYQKSGTTLSYEMSEVERLEIKDMGDDYRMKIYSSGSVEGNYKTEDIDSVDVSGDGSFYVYKDGS